MRSHDPAVPPRISRAGLGLAARRLRLPHGLAACGLVLWLLDLKTQIVAGPPTFMADAISYAAAGQHLLKSEPLYASFQLAGPYELGSATFGRGFVYPPTAALLFVPLAPLGSAALAVVFGIAWAAFGLLAFRLARRSGLESRASALLALVVTFSGPAISGASSGNLNLIVADGLLASWLWPGSAGTLAVLGGAIKFFPAAGLIWAVRKRRTLRWPLALGVVLVIATTVIIGMSGWNDFVTSFAYGRSSSGYFVISPSRLLGLFFEPGIGQLVGYSLAAVALAGAWRLKDESAAFALLGWAMILPAPDWYSHYLLVPLAAMLPWVVQKLVVAPQVQHPMIRRVRALTAG